MLFQLKIALNMKYVSPWESHNYYTISTLNGIMYRKQIRYIPVDAYASNGFAADAYIFAGRAKDSAAVSLVYEIILILWGCGTA